MKREFKVRYKIEIDVPENATADEVRKLIDKTSVYDSEGNLCDISVEDIKN